MLCSLLPNKSVEKILFFLLLNGKGYATQLAKRLETPLTPIQNSLQKLEKIGVLFCYYEGKTRFFELNTSFPLFFELEALLKKAYTHLPPHEKKQYYSPSFPVRAQHRPRNVLSKSQTGEKTISLFWEKLAHIQTMCFSAKSKSKGNTSLWNGIGKGDVEVKSEDECTLLFNERGKWISAENKEFEFSNVFCWRLDRAHNVITLEHMRFGKKNPVFLFSLIPVDSNTLESMDSHICNDDSYFGQIRCDNHFIQFNWRIIGPKKNEEIDYLYT